MVLSFKQFQEDIINCGQLIDINYNFEYENLTEREKIAGSNCSNFLYIAKNEEHRIIIGYSFMEASEGWWHGSYVVASNFPNALGELNTALSDDYLKTKKLLFFPYLHKAWKEAKNILKVDSDCLQS